ncbi:hypothetical protein [Actinomadura sp. 6N118]|uniref:hypothetical protein n=1 Tax=Actinomadura sp. 6N118 TaxID=3375151 RepID=UPI003798AB0E
MSAKTVYLPAPKGPTKAVIPVPGASKLTCWWTHTATLRLAVGFGSSGPYMWAATARLGPRFRVLGLRAGYVKHGLPSRSPAFRAGRRPATEREWGAEPEYLWAPSTRPNPVTALDAAAALTILEAARRSPAEGVTVRL